MKEGGLFWLQQPNTGMKLKKIIKEIENNDESTITVDKANYIALLRDKNVGIMLDTGHLMNTNPELQTEEDGIEYILKTVKALGEDRKLIRGLHLNCSLSGDYVKTFERVFDSESSNIERMKHVIKIDQHRPFTDKAVQKLLRFIKPDYVVHELAYRDFSDFEKNIEVQLTACGRKLSIDDEGD